MMKQTVLLLFFFVLCLQGCAGVDKSRPAAGPDRFYSDIGALVVISGAAAGAYAGATIADEGGAAGLFSGVIGGLAGAAAAAGIYWLFVSAFSGDKAEQPQVEYDEGILMPAGGEKLKGEK
ncbi:MAG TPA: hypothetical protein ENN43_04895 [bacterium]|nr:hypothetical protein [bacterium]